MNIANANFCINVCTIREGKSYRVTIVTPDGMTVGAARDSLDQCWAMAQKEIATWIKDNSK
jgi:hypothetical protein